MSWLSRNLPGILSTIGGGVLTATGIGAGIGVPMMAAGAGMLGTDASNEANKKSAERAQGFSQQSADTQMRFQEQMSNSAMTRAKQDALNAGYNPMLPAINNNQASSPTGANAKGEQSNNVDKIGSGLASAVSLRKMMNELDGTGSQIGLNTALGAKAAADANASTASAKESITRQKALESQLGSISKKAQYDVKKIDTDMPYIKLDAINSRVNQTANSAKAVIDVLPGGTLMKRGGEIIGGGRVNKKTGEILGEIANPPSGPVRRSKSYLPSGNYNKNWER